MHDPGPKLFSLPPALRRPSFLLIAIALSGCGKGLTQLGGFSGSLDPSFGSRGILVYAAASGSDYTTALAIHPPSGAVFAAGNYIEGANFFPHVRKFTSAGALDTSFAPVNRTTLSTVITDATLPVRIAPLTDGRLLMAGMCVGCSTQSGAPFVLRLTAAGTLDTTFGNSGIFALQIPGFNYGEGTDLQLGHPEFGPIWLAAHVSNGTGTNRWAVARLDYNGNLDTTFAGTGYQTYNPSSGDDLGAQLLLKADGGAFVGGTTYPGAGPNDETGDFALISVQPDGTQDMTFGVSGKAVKAFSSGRTDSPIGLHLMADGTILQTGKCKTASFDEVCFARWTTTGSLVSEMMKSYGQDLTLAGSILDYGGNLILPGSFPTPGGGLLAVTRFLTDDSVDTSFGTAGIASLSGALFGTPAAAAIDLSGRIYVAGYYVNFDSTSDSLIVRFLP